MLGQLLADTTAVFTGKLQAQEVRCIVFFHFHTAVFMSNKFNVAERAVDCERKVVLMLYV
ncbi:hypothetical protein D3C72_2592560 [compost metagenome]